jgi:hypothetical protein
MEGKKPGKSVSDFFTTTVLWSCYSDPDLAVLAQCFGVVTLTPISMLSLGEDQ